MPTANIGYSPMLGGGHICDLYIVLRVIGFNAYFSFQANDDDVELNGAVTYFFVNNGLPLPFMISNMTGEIIVNDTLDRDNPDTQEFHVDVIASDRGIPRRQVGLIRS